MVGLIGGCLSISPQAYSESFRSALTKFLCTSCIPFVANSTPQGLPMSISTCVLPDEGYQREVETSHIKVSCSLAKVRLTPTLSLFLIS